MATATGVPEGEHEKDEDLSSAHIPPVKDLVLVAAIDFGTTYSGFAYSFKHEYERLPTQMYSHKWTTGGGGIGMTSMKTPTTLLLDPDEKFLAFGYEAEESYANLTDDDAHEGYHYFKHFKMDLHKPKVRLSRKTTLKDDQGQDVLALKVFSESIAFLKRELLKSLKNREVTILNDDHIQWVLTIPAIWDDDAKQFMRLAAVEGGIKGDNLTLALEPEAASVYCKEIGVHKKEVTDNDCQQQENRQAFLAAFDVGTKYMVIDLGGGTVDITVSEVTKDRTLKLIFNTSGGAWGGVKINKEFWCLIKKLMQNHDIKKALAHNKSEELDLEREIECQKRDLKGDGAGKITIKLGPLTEYVDDGSAKKCGLTMKKGGKLQIPGGKLAEFFAPSVHSITKHVREIFDQLSDHVITDVILVGGFAESKIITDAIKTILRDLTVIHPADAGLAVLKGAVLYGHNPAVICARACPYTYGTANHRFFIEGQDDPAKKVIIDGTPYCKDVFNQLAEKGQIFAIGDCVRTEVYPLKKDMTKMSVHMYKTSEKNPKYTTDKGCVYMGKMVVDMPNTSKGMDRVVNVSLKFGKTELIYEGEDSDTGDKVEVKLDLLS